MIQHTVKNSQESTPVSSPESFLAGWLCIQASLAETAEVALCTLNHENQVVGVIENDNSICRMMQSSPLYSRLCDQDCGTAYHKAVNTNGIVEYRCHASLQCFASTITKGERPLVVLGGRAFTSSADYTGFLQDYASLELVQSGECLQNVLISDARELREVADLVETTAHYHLQNFSPVAEPPAAPEATPELLTAHLEIIRLSDELQNTSRAINHFQQFLQSVATSLDSEMVYTDVLEKFSELMKAERSSLMVLREDSGELALEATVGADFKPSSRIRIKLGEGISGAVLATGAPLLVRNVDTDRRVRRISHGRYKTKSFISYPITLGTKKIGVINLTDRVDGSTYESRDLSMLELIAPQLALIIDRTEWHRKAEQYQQMSLTDPLTGLPNRRYLEERLFEEVERCKRHDSILCFMLIDIDNFKTYNDKYGHTNADQILVQTASMLRCSVRAIDMPARYAGDEFCIILPETEFHAAAFIAERLCREVIMSEYLTEHGESMGTVTLSIGVSAFSRIRHTPLSIIETADRALYQAKSRGRNRVAVYDEAMTE